MFDPSLLTDQQARRVVGFLFAQAILGLAFALVIWTAILLGRWGGVLLVLVTPVLSSLSFLATSTWVYQVVYDYLDDGDWEDEDREDYDDDPDDSPSLSLKPSCYDRPELEPSVN